MKKLIIVLLLTACLPLSAKVYTPKNNICALDIIARGGYNFFENTPLACGSIAMQLYYFRTEMEVGWTYFPLPDNSDEHFCCVSTMVGCSYESTHSVYAMIGLANWGNAAINTDKPNLYVLKSMMRGKVKIGCNLFMTKRLFFNMDLNYIWPPLTKHPTQEIFTAYTGLNLTIGLGVRF